MRDSNYDLFLTNAICRPAVKSEYNYFLDEKNNRLICVPSSSSNSIHESWIELPKLSTQDKKKFILEFAKKQNESLLKFILKIENEFNDSSGFNIENELKEIDFDIAFMYSFESLDFLWDSINELYGPYNLNRNMEVIFDLD